MTGLLSLRELRVELPIDGTPKPILRGIDLDIGEGEAVGLVGESGSGKSMTARAIARTLPKGARTSGEITVAGERVLALSGAALRRYRTDVMGMIFQDPRAHINPVRRIGDFMTEALRTNRRVTSRAAQARAGELLTAVGLTDVEARMRQYPHQLSGGMLQRVMIAAALASEPRLILADEPTTALDVTTQNEVMAILDGLRRDRGVSMLFITHDLDLAAAVCDRLAVMYAGTLVEEQVSSRLHRWPQHPYSAGLSASRPRVDATAERLLAIPGRPLSAFDAPPGCAFAPRCRFAQDRCRETDPPMTPTSVGRVACVRHEEIAADLSGNGDPVALDPAGSQR
jgi:oligopeptide/dipeptide ABC transporter ATP-binding protein